GGAGEVSGGGGGSRGRGGGDDRGPQDRVDGTTSRESAYDGRRVRQQADDARQRHEAGVRATTGVAHFACAIAFTLVMHRTHLAGLKSRTADVVVRHGYGLTAERQRRGDNAGYLAGEPEADHPRQALADDTHRELDQISTRFVGMIGPQSREITLPRPIQFAIVIISFLVTFAAAAASAQDADQIPPQPHEHQHALANSSV